MSSSTPPSLTTPPRRLGVVPFDRVLVKDYLDREKIEATTDGDGDFIVNYQISELPQVAVTFLFMAQGINGEMYSIRCLSNVRLPEESIGPMVGMCNGWNSTNPLPTAYVMGETVEGEGNVGQIVLECHYPLGAGATQAIIDELTSTAMGSCFAFWNWFAQQGFLTGPVDEAAPVDESGQTESGQTESGQTESNLN